MEAGVSQLITPHSTLARDTQLTEVSGHQRVRGVPVDASLAPIGIAYGTTDASHEHRTR